MSQPQFRKAEEELATNRPYSDPEYLGECLWKVYHKRLELVEPRLPVAGQLRRALLSCAPSRRLLLIRDPSLRIAIDLAVTAIVLEHRPVCPAAVNEALEFAVSSVLAGEMSSILFSQDGDAIQLGQQWGYVWQTASPPTNAGQRLFLREFERILQGAGFILITPTHATVNSLQRGAALLKGLLPSLSDATMVHAPLIAIFRHEGGVFSVTNPHLPGVVFLAESTLTDPWRAAELLLHEAMHNKDVELENTHTLLAKRRADDGLSASVQPPWRRPYSHDPSIWSPKHALTVLHVYMALACLYAATISEHDMTAEYKVADAAGALLRDAFDRAEYLIGRLRTMQSDLGAAGLAMTEWASGLMQLLDPEPRVPGAVLHHLSSLYTKETRLVAKALTVPFVEHDGSASATHSRFDDARERVINLVENDRRLMTILSDRGAPTEQAIAIVTEVEEALATQNTVEGVRSLWLRSRAAVCSQLTERCTAWEKDYLRNRCDDGAPLEERLFAVAVDASPGYEWFMHLVMGGNSV